MLVRKFSENIASLSVLQGRYGSMCEKVQPRNGNKIAEQTATKVEILRLMDRMFEYRTKSGVKKLRKVL